ncbi:MAG: penicillin acylase family protein, partial [Chloroflexota bacterium]
MIKRLLFVSMLLLVAVVSVAAAQTDEPLPRPTEILWDSWGVPHIFAPDNESLFYAFGWAMATNHADLILQLYAESRGQAAAYFGADHLENDRLVRTLGIPQEAEAGYASAPPEWQTYADAFAAGINAYAEANPDDINPDALQVLPVTGVDIVAQGARTLRWNFVAGRGIRYALGQQPEPEPTGSNAWVVGPARSASGNAMLVANPHQPWSSFGLWMEAHFITPDVNLYGAALMGTPVLGIAFNERLGWTHTVNTHDGWDLYDLTLTADGGAYLFDGEARPFDIREEVIRIRQEDGSFTEEILTVRESVHGPVLAEQEPGRALALRVVGE